MTDPQNHLLDAILPHVPFDGWSDAAFQAAIQDAGLSDAQAQAACPRGVVDLAVLAHQRGDQAMQDAMAALALDDMRIRERVACAIRQRLDLAGDKEVVRRATTLFALPHLAPEGAHLIWGTADAIWRSLGDTSEDVNYYTKRATLSAVYGAVVLFWLGDTSEDGQATDDFIDRRIDDVMQIEKVKAGAKKNPLTRPFAAFLGQVTSTIKAPASPDPNLPGRWETPE